MSEPDKQEKAISQRDEDACKCGEGTVIRSMSTGGEYDGCSNRDCPHCN